MYRWSIFFRLAVFERTPSCTFAATIVGAPKPQRPQRREQDRLALNSLGIAWALCDLACTSYPPLDHYRGEMHAYTSLPVHEFARKNFRTRWRFVPRDQH